VENTYNLGDWLWVSKYRGTCTGFIRLSEHLQQRLRDTEKVFYRRSNNRAPTPMREIKEKDWIKR